MLPSHLANYNFIKYTTSVRFQLRIVLYHLYIQNYKILPITILCTLTPLNYKIQKLACNNGFYSVVTNLIYVLISLGLFSIKNMRKRRNIFRHVNLIHLPVTSSNLVARWRLFYHWRKVTGRYIQEYVVFNSSKISIIDIYIIEKINIFSIYLVFDKRTWMISSKFVGTSKIVITIKAAH